MLGLPAGITACLFDLDGVLTQTAKVHAHAWSAAFDEFLRRHAAQTGRDFVPFSSQDYISQVDGKRRADGVRDFLLSRDIVLPEGSPYDPPGSATVYGVGNSKNILLLEMIDRDGVEVYEGSVRYAKAVRAAGLSTAVVSSSANTEQVLNVTGLAELFDLRVDGITARKRSLAGKPAPDTYLDAAKSLGRAVAECAVFEDALAGVEAGQAGGFGFVVGVDRSGQARALQAHGADVVVSDLSELL